MKFMLCHLTESRRGQPQDFDTTALRFGRGAKSGQDERRRDAGRHRLAAASAWGRHRDGTAPRRSAVAILDAAVRHRAQLIVIGSRGLKAITRFLLGSVSQKVLIHSEGSVLIVR